MKPFQPRALTAPQQRYVLASLLITGASALVLEIVGARVISPYYGSSIYAWSAVITVTLISLAGGYNYGGRLADKAPSLTLFARLISLAGAAVAAAPALRIPVLKLTTPLGIQLGALASATILVGPALLLLSALGPLAIKLRAEALSSVGKSAGDVYAVSTLGSVAGASLAGFALIPNLAVSSIFYGLSCLLLLLGACGYYLSRLQLPLAQLAAGAAVGLIGFWPRPAAETNLLLNKDSAYGQIKVLDYDGRRYLLVNGTSQSVAAVSTMESESQYLHAFEWSALLRPAAKKALVIGVGAGLLPGAMEKHYGMTADSVDIDPEIVATARNYFKFSPRGEVFLEDGRTFLERGERRYGLIYLDAFGSELPPYHLLTAEAFGAMHRSLEPGGVLAINLVAMVNGPGGRAWLSAYRTLQAVFPEVRAFVASDASEDLANVVFFCSDAPLKDDGSLGRARPEIKKDLSLMLSRELLPTRENVAAGVLLTDDYAPMESLLAETAVRWRRGLQDKVSDLLLY